MSVLFIRMMMLLLLTLPPEIWVSHGFGMETLPTVEETTEPPTDDPGPLPYPDGPALQGIPVKTTYYGEYYGANYLTLDGGGQVCNDTDVPNDELAMLGRMPPHIPLPTDGTPAVLVLHTHTTACYLPEGSVVADPAFGYRTTDPAYDMAAVGAVFCEAIEAAGIGVVHAADVHDYPSCAGSYARSAETVQRCLEEWPDIAVVVDIHRGSTPMDGAVPQPVVTIAGRQTAQVRLVAEAVEGEAERTSFRLACMYQQQMAEDCPGLTRPIALGDHAYGTDLTPARLLLEVGTQGNTLSQACEAAALSGRALARTLRTLQEGS